MTQSQSDDKDRPFGNESPGGVISERKTEPAEPAETEEMAADLEPMAEPLQDEHEDHEEQHGSSFARMALMVLIGLLCVFGLALWLAPKLAPHLPGPIARHLMPGQAQIDENFAALDSRLAAERADAEERAAALEARIAELTERLGTAEQAAADAAAGAAAAEETARTAADQAGTGAASSQALDNAAAAAREAAATADIAATAATEAGKVAAAATRDAAALSLRMTEFEARVANLRDEMRQMSESLAGANGSGEGSGSPEMAAAFAQLSARVEALAAETEAAYVTEQDALAFATQDDLRSARTALETQIGEAVQQVLADESLAGTDDLAGLEERIGSRLDELSARLDAVAQSADEAAATAKAGEAAGTEALGKVEAAIRDASLRAAVAALVSRIENGVSYGAALDEVARLKGAEAPEALRAHAGPGLATTDELLRGFGRPAQAAIGAEIEAEAGDGILSWADAKIRSKVAGRPKDEQAGEDAAAILSRVEARLRAGDPAAALAEAETLPEPSRAALGDWLDRLRARVAAEAALETFVAAPGQQG